MEQSVDGASDGQDEKDWGRKDNRKGKVENEVYQVIVSRLSSPGYRLQVIVSWQPGNEEKGIPAGNPSREEMEETADRPQSALSSPLAESFRVPRRLDRWKGPSRRCGFGSTSAGGV